MVDFEMAQERLVIVGGGGFGRELLCWAADCHSAGRLPAVAGILDDSEDPLAGYDYSVSRLGGIEDYRPGDGDLFVMAIGDPAAKRRASEKLRGRGGRFANLIHPSAVVAHSARLDEGVVVCPQALISADAAVGQLVIINALSSVGHDARVGEYSTLSAHVDLTGFVSLGAGVLVGSGAKVLPKVKVGDGATIGAGATVYRNVPPGATAYAAPAKVMAAKQER
jgi:sugar O-acyltransferase (sialic acid O-acetyltransferase NeuD family)